MKKLILFLSLASIGFASVHHHGNFHKNFAADTQTGIQRYKVVYSTPIIKTVTKKVYTGDVVQNKVVHRKVPCRNTHSINRNSIGFDTIVGTVAGIAIGNQFHNHKDAAKVIGGLGGGYIANQMRQGDQGECYEESAVQEYTPSYQTVSEDVIVGYNNYIIVDGEKICKRSDQKRKFLKIKKSYSVY